MDNRKTWGENEYRGEGYPDTINFINFSFIPIRTSYGNLGFGYKEHKYAIDSTPKNTQQTLDIIDIPNDGLNKTGYENLPYTVYGDSDTHQGYYLITQEKYQRYTLLYSFPYNNNYMLDGFGISFGYEEGTKPYEGEDFLAVKTQYDGYRMGIGINKDKKDLGEGFSVKNFNLYTFNYNQNIPYSYRTNKNINLGDVKELGAESEFWYIFKTKGKNTYYTSLNLELAKATHNIIRESDVSVIGKSDERLFNAEIYVGMIF